MIWLQNECFLKNIQTSLALKRYPIAATAQPYSYSLRIYSQLFHALPKWPFLLSPRPCWSLLALIFTCILYYTPVCLIMFTGNSSTHLCICLPLDLKDFASSRYQSLTGLFKQTDTTTLSCIVFLEICPQKVKSSL